MALRAAFIQFCATQSPRIILQQPDSHSLDSEHLRSGGADRAQTRVEVGPAAIVAIGEAHERSRLSSHPVDARRFRFLAQLAGSHIVHHTLHRRRPAEFYRHAARLDPDEAPVQAAYARLQHLDRSAVLEHLTSPRRDHLAVLVRDERNDGPAYELGTGLRADQLYPGVVDEQQLGAAMHENRLGERVNQRAVAVLAFLQVFLGTLPFGEVAHDRQRHRRLTGV